MVLSDCKNHFNPITKDSFIHASLTFFIRTDYNIAICYS